jgi:hypothetical protein
VVSVASIATAVSVAIAVDVTVIATADPIAGAATPR